jgi:hypothetical protein
MAHFAELDSNNIVLRVMVIHNNELLDENGQESEAKGIAFCKSIFGENTVWKQTSYNKKFRKNYASVGYQYNPVSDAFIAPQPFPSWTLNEDTYQWDAPVPCPDDGHLYIWNEATKSWDKFAKDVLSKE